MILDHWGATEADFAATYGIDLRDACYGRSRVGVRRLVALVRGLPIGGALHRAMDPTGWRWSNVEELLAALVELVDLGNRQFFAANREKGTPLPEPVKVVRPGHEAKPAAPRPVANDAEIRQFFGGALRVVKS